MLPSRPRGAGGLPARSNTCHGDRDGGLDPLSGQDVGRGASTRVATSRAWCATRRDLCRTRSRTYVFVSTLSVYPDDAPAWAARRRPRRASRRSQDTEEITDESYGTIEGGRASSRRRRRSPAGASSSVRGLHRGARTTLGSIHLPGPPAPWPGADARPGPAGPTRCRSSTVGDLGAFTLDHMEAGTANDVFGVVGSARAAHVEPDAVPPWMSGRRGHRAHVGDAGVPARPHAKDEDGELPLWDIEYPGLHSFDASKAIAAGCTTARSAETIADTARVGSRSWRR